METRFIALKLVMEALPLPPLLYDTALPHHTHATLFLTQHFAVDLGYHFWWTEHGPMSPLLDQDIQAIRRGCKINCVTGYHDGSIH